MSATMGYEPMARLTHQMETVLEPIRAGTQSLSTQLVDALFVCLDQLEKWLQVLTIQDIIEEGGLQSSLNLLQQSSREVTNSSTSPSRPVGTATDRDPPLVFSDSEKEILSQARMNGFSVFKVMVELSVECAFKEVRAFMILKNVNELSEIVKSNPAPNEIEKGLFDRRFFLVVITDSPADKLQQALSNVSEVSGILVEPFYAENDPTQEGKTVTASFVIAAPAVVAEERAFVLPTIRVHTSKLDKLMALVQELVISKVRFEQVAHSRELKELSDPLSQLNHITDDLQDEIMKVRLMSVKQIFERFPRMVRDLAKSLNKQVDLEMEGAEVELDR
ncbi:MAG TPA: hypothetical protein VIJ93_13050, partial [bacterium]